MNEKEAVEELKAMMAHSMSYRTEKTDEAYRIAIESLKKHIPMKPIIRHYKEDCEGGEIHSYYMCGNLCDSYCEVHKQDKFCKHCGQPIDWSGI